VEEEEKNKMEKKESSTGRREAPIYIECVQHGVPWQGWPSEGFGQQTGIGLSCP
jgi:hypothetical protein